MFDILKKSYHLSIFGDDKVGFGLNLNVSELKLTLVTMSISTGLSHNADAIGREITSHSPFFSHWCFSDVVPG